VAVLFAANGATLAGAVTRYPDIKAALGLSNTALGAAVGAYWVGALLVGAVAGALVARLGSARVAWAATVVSGLALAATGAAPAWLLLAAALFVAGGADAVADVARTRRRCGRSAFTAARSSTRCTRCGASGP
jgi:MFS family permease